MHWNVLDVAVVGFNFMEVITETMPPWLAKGRAAGAFAFWHVPNEGVGLLKGVRCFPCGFP